MMTSATVMPVPMTETTCLGPAIWIAKIDCRSISNNEARRIVALIGAMRGTTQPTEETR